MKIRVPFGWFWYGDDQYGTPEVEAGTIAASNPQPPAQALARRVAQLPMANDGGALPEEELEAYRTPTHEERLAAEEAARPRTVEEDLAAMKGELRQVRGSVDQVQRGPQ